MVCCLGIPVTVHAIDIHVHSLTVSIVFLDHTVVPSNVDTAGAYKMCHDNFRGEMIALGQRLVRGPDFSCVHY